MASGADRISNLPEVILHHILSLLPAQDAVRTCVLAQSWRHHWRSAPAVRVAGCTGWAGGVYTFGPFVDGLLSARRGGAPLESCDFELDVDLDLGPYDVPKMQRHVNGWIRRALRRGVRDLRFRVSVSSTPRLPLTLEDRPLVSEHLTRLELVGVQGNAGVLDFSCCPALENLVIEDCDVRSLEMHSPSVKHLRIRYCLFYSNNRTWMSFPSLVSFEFITNVGRVPVLDSLTEATELKLSAYPDLYVFNRDLEWCPTFSKLKTLVLGYWFVSTDLSALIWFLRHAPLLEKLTLKYLKVDNNPTKMEVNDKALEQPIAASHLQIVEIKCKCVDGIVLEILEVLNDIGVPQEKVRVKVSGRKLSMNSHDSLCNCRVP
ncbi:hypothetical protein HU200_054546 [Digitaria exilis]|uniref:F-box domain-containing protein n=1 Tax=Digitaria exilis TaxID=1010633 RepID=A0A835AKP5_9POAL|nr:hypothetical protein HU200_054546 [Digitaria exilis]